MLKEKLDHIFNTYLEKAYFSGAVCLVSKDDEIIFSDSYGTTNNPSLMGEKEPYQNMTLDTMFDLASITKIYISTLVLSAISKKILSLDTRLIECLPEIKNCKELSDKVGHLTVKRLLTHSSGIRDWYAFYSRRNESFYEILKSITDYTNSEKVVYSDINFMLLGKILEEKFSMNLEKCIHTMLVEPLELNTLTYGPVDGENIAATEFGNKTEQGMCKERGLVFNDWRSMETAIRGEVNDGNCYYYFNGVAGHAGLFASAWDVLKLGQLYIKGGIWNGSSVINQDLTQMSVEEQCDTRGLGWQISDIFPKGCGHTGFTGPSMWIVPEEDLVVVTLTNRQNVRKPRSIQNFRAKLHHEILKQI